MNTKYYVFGETIYYTYDNLNRLSSVQYSTAGTENYTYDNAGNRLSKTNYNAAGGVTTVNISAVYTYDSLNRMTESLTDDIILAYKGRTTYQYDNSGSLLTETTTQLDYISEQVLETDLETGLPILPQIKSYSYNAFEQNISVTNADGSYQQIIYDARGLRISTIENGYRSDFVFDRGSIIAEFDGSGTLTSRNIRGYDLLAQKDDKDRLNYYLHNAHGDITSMIDASGKVLNSYQYDAFGDTITYSETVANRFRYTGEQFDTITGQYYLRARYYDPQVGRFTQEDTYRGDGLNLYAYVGNNPVSFVDPSGHEKCEFMHNVQLGVCSSLIQTGVDSIQLQNDVIVGFFAPELADKINNALGRKRSEAISVIESEVTDEAVYYGAKVVTDAALVAGSIYGTIKGAVVAGKGAATFVGGFTTGPGAALISTTGAVIVAAGVLEVEVSLSVGISAAANIWGDANSFKEAVKGEGRGEHKFNVDKQESKVWKELDNVKGKNRKTSGYGKNKKYYEWDYTHNDIEVYNNKGQHLGSMDPVTGEMYKSAVKGRNIKFD